MKDFIQFLWGVDKRYRFVITLLLGLTLVQEGISILLPYFSGNIIDRISDGTATSFVPIAGLVGLYFIILLFDRLVGYYRQQEDTQKFAFDFRPDVFKSGIANFFNFSAGEHTQGNSHKKASVLREGVGASQNLTGLLFYNVIPMTLRLIVLLAALAYIKPVYAIIIFVSVAINIALQSVLVSKMMPEFDLWQKKSKIRHKMIGEHIRNADLTKNIGAEDFAVKDLMSYVRAAEEAGKNLWYTFEKKLTLIGLLNPVTVALLFLIGSWQAYIGIVSVGEFLMIVSWGGMAIANIRRVQWIQRETMNSLPAFRDFRKQLSKIPELTYAENPIKNAITEGRIEYVKVSHSYENNPEKTFSMKNISFVIEPGQKVAFAGVSGSGKSTLVKILLRNFDPEKGQVLIDGHDLRELDLSDYQSHIGYVSQETRLFDSTIKKNLTYGLKRRVTNKELEKVLNLANLKKKILGAKKGLNSKIGEQGIQLSGGERQRLAIARAMLRDPKILIFDEATSSLDAINEKEIQEAIDKAAKGRTSIMIAHRLSTVINADKIFFFETGRLVASGSHKDLLVKSKKYKELCSHQYLDL